jgi:hypothetical protein
MTDINVSNSNLISAPEVAAEVSESSPVDRNQRPASLPHSCKGRPLALSSQLGLNGSPDRRRVRSRNGWNRRRRTESAWRPAVSTRHR